MSNIIYVFTLNGCGHCIHLKNDLNEQNIPYTEIPIEKNQEVWNQVVSQTGHNPLPTVFISIDGQDDGPVYIPGRDYTDKSEVIEKIKTYL